MKKTYSGTLGSFYRGGKYDLPEKTIKQLDKDCYEKTCAPWDEHVDRKAAKHNAFLAKVQKAIIRAEALTKECRICAGSIEKMQEALKQKVKDRDNAVKKAKKLAKAAGIKWPPKDAADSEGQAVKA